VRGLGCDLVSVARVAGLLGRHAGRFAARCFAPGELAAAAGVTGGAGPADGTPAGDVAGALAEAWAAKEAFLKAVGAPLGSVPLPDIAVARPAAGPPRFALGPAARAVLARRGADRAHLALSRRAGHAVAVVVLE
jgi:holo-[acyl-carrier protein] synthase